MSSNAEPAAATSASRTYTWPEPDEAQAALRGLASLEAIRDGLAPGAPIMYTLGWTVTAAERGRVELCLEPQRFHLNPHRVHGGVIATLLDSATACAVISTLSDNETSTTLELKTNFLRAVSLELDAVRCIGTVVHRGSRVAVSEATLLDPAGKPLARASATSLIMGRNPEPDAHNEADS